MGAHPVAPPDPRAPHVDWMAYAVGQGMPEGQARGLTRDQLRASFPRLIGGVPYLERHDQDPEAVAARREARS